MQTETERPGSAVFYGVLLAVSLFLLWEAYGIRGAGQASGPATIPLAATGFMVLTSLALLIKSLASGLKGVWPSFAELRRLLPLSILGYMIFSAMFVLLVGVLGFWISAAGFLAGSFFALHRSSPLRTVAITAMTLVIVRIVFVFLFGIYLP